jgi:hypothetical protein
MKIERVPTFIFFRGTEGDFIVNFPPYRIADKDVVGYSFGDVREEASPVITYKSQLHRESLLAVGVPCGFDHPLIRHTLLEDVLAALLFLQTSIPTVLRF